MNNNSHSIKLNGESSYVIIPKVNYGDKSFTRSITFTAKSISAFPLWSDYGFSGIESFVEITSGKIRLYWNNGEIDKSFGTIEENTKYTFTLVRDVEKNNFKFYVNDELLIVLDGCGGSKATNKPLYLGYDSRNYYMNGNIDSFIMWDKVLTEKEIYYYNSFSLTGMEENLVCYIPFDEGKGNVAYDRSKTKTCAELKKCEWEDGLENLKVIEYFLLKKDEKYFALNSGVKELGIPKSKDELNKWYKYYGIRDLNEMLKTLKSKSISLISAENESYENITIEPIDFNEVIGNIHYQTLDNSIIFEVEPYSLKNQIEKYLPEHFKLISKIL